MRFFYILRIIALFVSGNTIAGEKASAQSFGLSVTHSASSILVSNSVTYTIDLTNLISGLIPIVVVSNVLPTSVQFVSASSTQGVFTNYGNITVFYLGQFVAANAEMILTVQPTAVGFITNAITLVTTNFVNNVTLTTNSVTQVTNVVPTQADLGVTLAGPLQAIIVNDSMTYNITATNLGPGTAPAVLLTNTLPPGVIFKSVSPNVAFNVIGSNRVFNLGTLASGGGTNLFFTVQPTNAGVLNFFTSIGAASIVDPNLTNNFTSTNLTIFNYFSGPLFVVTNSAQLPNPQNGLTEQSIFLSNNVGTNVFAVRVVVTNLTKQLFNAVGTNNGNPFVVLNTSLNAGDSVNLLLQFAPRGSFPLASSQLQAFAVPPLNLTPPAISSSSKLLNISRIVPLTNGTMLIEFPSVLGRRYTVVYSDNISFSNAMIAPPSIVAPANRVQWIDYGPPATTNSPAHSTNRFYRVFQN
jgi:uncharacterized repeat protein (TIGR01451 family)